MAVTAPLPPYPFIYTAAFITEDIQTVIVRESSAIRLDWLKWVTEVLGASAINATYTLRKAQLDEHRNPVEPLETIDLSSQGRIAVQFDVERNKYSIQVT